MAINLETNQYSAQFNAFVQFAKNKDLTEDTLVRIDASEKGPGFLGPNGVPRKIVVKEGDEIKGFTNPFFIRSKTHKDLNFAVRELFLKTILDVCNVTDVDKLPPAVRAVLNKGDFGKAGHPLSVRRIRAITEAVREVARSEGSDVDKIEASLNEKAGRIVENNVKDEGGEKFINIDEGQVKEEPDIDTGRKSGKSIINTEVNPPKIDDDNENENIEAEDESEAANLDDSYVAPEEVAELKDEDRVLSVDAKPDEVKVYPKEIEGPDYAPSKDVVNLLEHVPEETKNKFLRFYATMYYDLKFKAFYDGEPPKKAEIDEAYLKLFLLLRYSGKNKASKMAMALELIMSGKVSFCDREARFRTDIDYIKDLAEHLTNIIDFVEENRKIHGDAVADIVFDTINSWTRIIRPDDLKVLDKDQYEEMKDVASGVPSARIGFEITMKSKQSLVDGFNRVRKLIFDEFKNELQDKKDSPLANELKRNIFLALAMKEFERGAHAMPYNLHMHYNALAQNSKQRAFLNIAISMMEKKDYILKPE